MVSPSPNRKPWLLGAAAFAVIAGGLGFLLGGLGDAPPTAMGSTTPVASGPELAAVGHTEQPAHTATVPATVDDGPCPPGMVRIAGGKLFVGSDRDVPVLAGASPAHQVEVGPYCIDVHEVTVDDYRECSDRGECKRAYRSSAWPGSDPHEAAYDELCNERYDDRGQHPINCVSWDQAVGYCEQRGGRLPTEVEWELAARGSDGRVYPWGDAPPDAEHINGCGAECRTWRAARGLPDTAALLYPASDKYPGTAPVGSFPAGRTQWGLDDIAGNVFEWTADEYRPYPGSNAPPPPDDGIARRVIRGGAFNSYQPEHADPALRFPQADSAHTHGIGFRCAASVRP